MDCLLSDVETVRWKDLPETVLSHVLRLAPYKRADVKLVCQSWRTAVNASLKSVTIPERDLDLLHQLTAVQELTVTAAAEGTQGSVQRAAQSLEAGFSALHTTPGSNTSTSSKCSSNPWSNAHPSSMQRLRVLNLQNCPTVFRQLVEWQEQQFKASTTTFRTSGASPDSSDGRNSSSSERMRPGLDRLEELMLDNLENVFPELAILLVGHLQDASRLLPAVTISKMATLPHWPLQHLSTLHINRCRVVYNVAEVLPQLPALRSLEVFKCPMWEVPAGICDCTTLTQLKLPETQIHCLPEAISNLQQLQVLDLSSNIILVSLSSGISRLTQLTELDLSGPNLLFKKGPSTEFIRSPRFAIYAAGIQYDAADTSHSLGLDLHENRMHALPEQQQLGVLSEVSSLCSLRRLRLAHNRDMRVLPSSVCSLTQLERLDAGSCSLRYLNDELWQCVGLKELLLGDNVLAVLSEDIRGLTALEVLDITRNTSLWRLPSALISLPQLRRLLLSSKAVGQDVVERLELRAPNPVDVQLDGFDGHSDDFYDYYAFEEEDLPPEYSGFDDFDIDDIPSE